jgi:hypothetical protein
VPTITLRSNQEPKGSLKGRQDMSHKLIDENGVTITGQIRMVFVCDMCANTSDFYHGMTTFAKTVGEKVTQESYCSEICARKAVA